jgi:hypothetical protein
VKNGEDRRGVTLVAEESGRGSRAMAHVAPSGDGRGSGTVGCSMQRSDSGLAGVGLGEAARWAGPVCTVPLSYYFKKLKLI